MSVCSPLSGSACVQVEYAVRKLSRVCVLLRLVAGAAVSSVTSAWDTLPRPSAANTPADSVPGRQLQRLSALSQLPRRRTARMLASSSHRPYPRDRALNDSACVETPSYMLPGASAKATEGETGLWDAGEVPWSTAAGDRVLLGRWARSVPSANVLLARVTVDASGAGGEEGCGLLRG